MTALPDFLIIGQEDWDEIWRRNQFLIAGLARRCPSTKFLFVELPCNLSGELVNAIFNNKSSTLPLKWEQVRSGLRSCPEAPNIRLLTLPKIVPTSWPGGLWFHNYLTAKLIRRACLSLGISRPLLWTQNPEAAPLIERLNTSAVIYDNTDDWTAAGFRGKAQERAVNWDYYLARRADIVFTCSRLLTEQKRAVGAPVVYVRNGVDNKLYDTSLQITSSDPVLKGLPRPILGYTGSLHARRLNLPLVIGLASARPEWSLVFIGPNYLTQEQAQLLKTRPNIHIIEPKPYKSLPAILHQFDALILPHQVNSFTESLDPIKFYEYLASGRPIISTPVAGVREYAELVYLAEEVSDFIQKVEVAQTEDSVIPQLRKRVAQSQDWEYRVDEVLTYLEVLISDKSELEMNKIN